MLITFFVVRCIVPSEFFPHDQTTNQQVYRQILLHLLRSVRRKRRDLWQNNSWLLHHDNASAHTAHSIRQFLAEKNITVLDHPPYSPDLAPCDFFLFPKVKGVLKETRFGEVEKDVASETHNPSVGQHKPSPDINQWLKNSEFLPV